jgi:DNA-directed RNA polymerase specialized sigma subunit
MISAEEYLRQLGNINAAIDQDIKRLEEMRARAIGGSGIRYDKDRVQSSPVDSLSAAVISIVDLDSRINQTIDKYVEAKETIIEQIRGLHNEMYTRILYDVYVQGMTIKETAADIGRGHSIVTKHKSKALKEFEAAYSPLNYLT